MICIEVGDEMLDPGAQVALGDGVAMRKESACQDGEPDRGFGEPRGLLGR
jgi:hypothetical protein